MIQFTLEDNNKEWYWSGEFNLQSVGIINFRIRDKMHSTRRYFRIDIINANSVIYLNIFEFGLNNNAYVLENKTKQFNINFYQFGQEEDITEIKSSENVAYAWDFPNEKKELIILFQDENRNYESKSEAFLIDKINLKKEILFKSKNLDYDDIIIVGMVRVEGITKILQFYEKSSKKTYPLINLGNNLKKNNSFF